MSATEHEYGRVVRTVTDKAGGEWLVIQPDPKLGRQIEQRREDDQLRAEHRARAAAAAAPADFDIWLLRRAWRAVEARRKRGANPAVEPMHREVRHLDSGVVEVDCTAPKPCLHCAGVL